MQQNIHNFSDYIKQLIDTVSPQFLNNPLTVIEAAYILTQLNYKENPELAFEQAKKVLSIFPYYKYHNNYIDAMEKAIEEVLYGQLEALSRRTGYKPVGPKQSRIY